MIGEKLRELLAVRGMKQTELSRLTGISKTTINSIITRNNKSVDFSAMEKIADALGVPIEYFMEKSIKEEPLNTEEPLRAAPDETDLLHRYRGLDDFGRKAVRAVVTVEEERVARARLQGQALPAARSNIVTIQRFVDPAAAGSPLWAESGSEFVEYPADLVPDGTDFAVGISGRSMEPDYPDGCTVFVRRTQTVQDGDVILAWLEVEGGMVCKRARGGLGHILRLESINPDYESYGMQDLEDMRVYGKVLGYVMG